MAGLIYRSQIFALLSSFLVVAEIEKEKLAIAGRHYHHVLISGQRLLNYRGEIMKATGNGRDVWCLPSTN